MKMRYTKGFLCLMLAAILAVGLPACGGKEDAADSEAQEALTAADLAGEYRLVSLEGENALAKEDIESMNELGLRATLRLEEDGSGLLDLFGIETEVSFDAKAMTFDMSGETLSFTYQDGALALERSTEKMVFKPME